MKSSQGSKISYNIYLPRIRIQEEKIKNEKIRKYKGLLINQTPLSLIENKTKINLDFRKIIFQNFKRTIADMIRKVKIIDSNYFDFPGKKNSSNNLNKPKILQKAIKSKNYIQKIPYFSTNKKLNFNTQNSGGIRNTKSKTLTPLRQNIIPFTDLSKKIRNLKKKEKLCNLVAKNNLKTQKNQSSYIPHAKNTDSAHDLVTNINKNKNCDDFDHVKIFHRFDSKFKTLPENKYVKNTIIDKIEENLSIESSIENILLQNDENINCAQMKDSIEKKRNIEKSPFAELIDSNLSDYVNNSEMNNKNCSFLSNSWFKNSHSGNSSPKEKSFTKHTFLNKKFSKGNDLRKAQIFNKISENESNINQ